MVQTKSTLIAEVSVRKLADFLKVFAHLFAFQDASVSKVSKEKANFRLAYQHRNVKNDQFCSENVKISFGINKKFKMHS